MHSQQMPAWPLSCPSSRPEGQGPGPTIRLHRKAGQGGDTQSASLRPGEGRDKRLPFTGAAMWGHCQMPSLESGLGIQIPA